MAEFVVFAKRRDPLEAQLRVFCMTDDKEDKTLESQEHFTEVAKSRDVEVLEGKHQFLEFAGNLVPVTKSGEQLSFTFRAFRENRLPFTIRVKDTHQEPMGRVAFMREARVSRGEPPQSPICNLNIVLPEADLTPVSELVTLEKKYGFVTESSLAKPEQIHRADLRLSDIAKGLGSDWIALALQLDLSESEINSIRSENPSDVSQQAHAMLKYWLKRSGSRANGNLLEKGLRKINREDIVNECMFNVELVTDDVERAVAKVHLDQSGFDTFKEELGPSRDASLRRDTSLNGTYDEQDIMKDAESAAETSSESSDRDAHFRSEKRHSGSRKTETSSHSNKGTEDGPDTLVQHIPTAMAESYTQNVSNGQVSANNSVHEDDKSEPTAATLSSEATADNEVSSLGDTSEKREYAPRYGGYKMSAKNAPRSSKSVKEIKRNNREMSKRKVSFSVNPWTMTVSVANKRRKKIVRRNTWPADSPRKLNMQKKYQQRLKAKSFPEPFWSNTYEWLVMAHSPEEVKCAPLAKLTEFVDLVTVRNFTPVTPYTYKSPLEFYSNTEKKPVKAEVPKTKHKDTLGFYFVVNVNKKVSNDPKKYLMKLKKRCKSDMDPCPVRSLNVTRFTNSSIKEEKPLFNDEVYSTDTFNQIMRQPFQDTNNALEDYLISENYIIGNNAEVEIEDTISAPFHVTYQQLNTPMRAPRPFQVPDVELFGDVLTHSSMAYLDNDVISLKSKISVPYAGWNKENVVRNNKTNSPYVKYPKPAEKFKMPVLNTMSKKLQDVATSRKPLENKPVLRSPSNSDKKIGIYKLPKDMDTKNPDITRVPQDMPDQKSPGSDKSGSAKDSVSSSSQSTSYGSSSVHTVPSGDATSGDTSPGEGSSSNFGQKSKPYARQLFEKDIHSKVPKTSKTKDKDTKTEESTKPKATSGSVQESVDDKTLSGSDNSEKQNTTSSTVPSEVVGFSFLKYLRDHVESEESAKEATFPASVIGHAFLNALVEQQNKSPENVQQEKTIPASVLGLSFLKNLCEEEKGRESNEQFPASALGQAFLDTLAASQNQPKTSDDKSARAAKSLAEESETKSQQTGTTTTIPSNVLGQTFLKNLLEQSISVQGAGAEEPSTSEDLEKSSSQTIPASVLGHSFIKTLVQETEDERKKSTVPAPVLGQAFLKSLIERQTEMSEQSEKGIPSSVAEQNFLKNLIEDQSKVASREEKCVPASVVGQAFLKSLIDVDSSGEQPSDESNKTIPSNVVGQAFLKTLLDQGTVKEDEGKAKPVPSTVVSQAFLKSLMGVEQPREESSEESNKAIPSTVVGQAFLKTLLDQGTVKEDEGQAKPVPSTVVSQAFLKSLMGAGQPSEESSEESNKAIPSSVVGQAFLKTLLDQGTIKESESNPKPVPSNVVGQAFLKSLMGHEQPHEESPEKSSQVIPSTVVGQAFLKTLFEQGTSKEDKGSSKTIPSSVVGQSFLKSLTEMESSNTNAQSADTKTIPSTVVSQAFMKMLVDQEQSKTHKVSESEQAQRSEKVIPATALSQSFLKSLIDMGKSSSVDESSEKPIPSSVVSQAFLKTLISETPTGVKRQEEKSLPASVVSQAFLKTLLDQGASSSDSSVSKEDNTSKSSPEDHSENVIPSAVLGQTFLMSLLQQGSSASEATELGSSKKSENPVPATVIGSAFLKALSDESCSETHSVSDKTKESKPMTANVIGQAFLKTLLTMSPGTPPESPSTETHEVLEQASVKHTELQSFPKEELNGNSSSAFVTYSGVPLDEENVIIPPPPEFSSTQPIPSTSSDIDPTSEIIGELLSYTKMMHSVIESLKDSSSSETDPSKK